MCYLSSPKQAFLLTPATCLTYNVTERGYLSGNNLLNSLFPRSLVLFAEIANKVTTSVDCACVYYRLQGSEDGNSSQISPAVKHWGQMFAEKQMKVGCKGHHGTNFIDTPMNNCLCCSPLIPLSTF